MPITDEDRARRERFAVYFEAAVRAAGYVRSNGELDVPALHRMSGVPDNVLRRWLNRESEPSIPNMRLVAPALGIEPNKLYVASEQLLPEEVNMAGPPPPPTAPPTAEERIMADDLLSDDAKAALIHTLKVMRERSSSPEEPRRRNRA